MLGLGMNILPVATMRQTKVERLEFPIHTLLTSTHTWLYAVHMYFKYAQLSVYDIVDLNARWVEFKPMLAYYEKNTIPFDFTTDFFRKDSRSMVVFRREWQEQFNGILQAVIELGSDGREFIEENQPLIQISSLSAERQLQLSHEFSEWYEARFSSENHLHRMAMRFHVRGEFQKSLCALVLGTQPAHKVLFDRYAYEVPVPDLSPVVANLFDDMDVMNDPACFELGHAWTSSRTSSDIYCLECGEIRTYIDAENHELNDGPEFNKLTSDRLKEPF